MEPTDRASLLLRVLQDRFQLQSFRPHQAEACDAVASGQDVLVVMPTGSGKSLCYQLPGIARGGTTLVISPLIALIEDQVAKLETLGFATARIHSGRSREESRQVCRDYLAGELDFLYVAPERLSVPGFPELLARRKPTLIAVDEAHCISHWGHDFRPDYRLLGERLPLLRPSPIVALTATATVRVQKDIVRSLQLENANLITRGFWRDNLAVEVREASRSLRPQLVKELLDQPDALPAIVYVPTRKEAEALALGLARHGAVPYHAGMNPEERHRSQLAFMEDKAQVVVATVAFGMGVDKSNIRTIVHTALPGSVESYYQEIGRGGRDGKPCRVVLFYAWSDRKLLEFLHNLSYPDPDFVKEVGKKVPKEPTHRTEVFDDATEEDSTESALRQLYNHNAISWTPDDRIASTGKRGWLKEYVAQREHRKGQIEDTLQFAQSGSCRMHDLVRYFSPPEAAGKQCGICDHCAPQDARSRAFQIPTATHQERLDDILSALRERAGQTPRQLIDSAFSSGGVDRDLLEAYLGCLSRGGLLRAESDSFEKDGRTISFQRLFLTSEGRQARNLQDVELWLEAPTITPATPKKRQRKPGSKKNSKIIERLVPTVQADACRKMLTQWRTKRAKAAHAPPFRILSNAAITAIARSGPRNIEELLLVRGIGSVKASELGAEILDIVRQSRLDS